MFRAAVIAFLGFCLIAAPALAGSAPGSAIVALAPGAPGDIPHWTSGNKQGVGTAITSESHVWFTIGNGVLNEVYYPTVDKANTRDLELIVTDGKTFADLESRDTLHSVDAPDPKALVFRQRNTARNGRYRITKTYVTDPQRDAVLIQIRMDVLKPGAPLKVYVYYDPSLNNSGMNDTAYTEGDALIASKLQSRVPASDEIGTTPGDISSALIAQPPFVSASNGFVGVNDGWSEIKSSRHLTKLYNRAEDGNIAQIGELPASLTQGKPVTVALGFGSDDRAAVEAARGALNAGFASCHAAYTNGWHSYVARLKQPDSPYRLQFLRSAMTLRAHEDKLHPGAIVASLTIPWGDYADASKPNIGGYHLVWSRDLYQIATAFLAMGDRATAERSLDYLFNTQQRPDGSFPQNSWLTGKPYWKSLQLDEVALPIVLAWQLERADKHTYEQHIRPAANFVAAKGPWSPQERWEEQDGYSPSTIAAEISGLICAADLARRNGDTASADAWTKVADAWAAQLDQWTATTTGKYAPRYFLRITQHGKPDAGEQITLKNGSGTWDEREIVDAGFLELVRLGIRDPNDKVIEQSLKVIDKVIKVDTPLGPAWYRYNHDGYGEKTSGLGYDGTGIGRLWPLFAGERGEYEISRGNDARFYLDLMQRMGNQGGMLSEQVWDRSEQPLAGLSFARPTGSANPLAWTNAQFIRLAIAQKEHRLPETPSVVQEHFKLVGPRSVADRGTSSILK